MAWTTPKTWATNELVTAALMNQQLRDNMNVVVAAIVPTGSVVPFAGSTTPTSNWLICNGAAVSRTTYAALFTAIGTTYGAGDGSTTFNVPDLRGRYPLGKDNMGGTSANRVTAAVADQLGGSSGAENHTLTIAEMPAHTHSYQQPTYSLNFSGGGSNGSGGSSSVATGSAGSGSAHNNMPPYITLNYIIKT